MKALAESGSGLIIKSLETGRNKHSHHSIRDAIEAFMLALKGMSILLVQARQKVEYRRSFKKKCLTAIIKSTKLDL
ncbi:MAG: hypothetical protein JKY01_03565 [Pseudomonadales bacterium]|nr:hypothetical protein [Pseudomonadales bacterium]